jgi:hypothetical protein
MTDDVVELRRNWRNRWQLVTCCACFCVCVCARACACSHARVHVCVCMHTCLQLGGSMFRSNYFIHIDWKMFTECQIGPDFARFWQHTCAMLPLCRITLSCMIFRLRAQISTVSWLLSLVNSLQWYCCTLSHVHTNIYIYIRKCYLKSYGKC